MTDLLSHLNPAQKDAVTHMGGPLMIIAGAGSGKTRVITHRIAFLHRECGIPLNEIMAVTFTNKAAREMRARVCRLMGVPDTPGLPIGTFHSRCAMILRRDAAAAGLDANFAILDENDQKQAIKRVTKELEISDKRVRPGQVQSFINQAKMQLLTPADCKEELDEDEAPYAEIYERYQQVLEKNKSVDFEDLMMKTVLLFQENEEIRKKWSGRYQYVLIDEYQDTNHAQFLLSKLLAQGHEQICVVGDEDQSIYSWRGAEIRNLLDFETSFPGTRIIKLEHNYRSSGNILKAASTIIDHNTQRIGKVLYTTRGDGAPLAFHLSPDQDVEAKDICMECLRLIQSEGVNPDEIAVFYRGHWLSRSVEDAMRKYRLPYRVVGGMRFYDRAEVKDLLSYLRLAVNPEDDLAFERVVNRPARGVGPKALSQISGRSARDGVSLREAASRVLGDGELKGKARKGIEHLLSCLSDWVSMEESAAPHEVLERILEDTNFKQDGVGDPDSFEGEARIENIEELEGLMQGFEPEAERHQLAEFLATMALDATEDKQDNSPKVSLLTMHNAKGLEYDYVFIVGLEKGVFPTSRAEESFDEYAIEEERRLFYVGITRAREKLHLMYSMRRNRPDYFFNSPSPFLSELPASVFDEESIKQLRRLLPYGWGQERELGGSRREEGDWEYVMDENPDAVFSPQKSEPRTFSRMTRGLGIGRGGPSLPGGQKPQFTPGQRIVHKYMGSGTIEKIGGRPGWERVYIAFDDGKTQDFILKYAPLKPE